MFSTFLDLEQGKQKRILNAAMKEFAQKGYQLASTNEIVKEAGISKGMLFYYFQNKKQLFLFLYEYGTEKTVTEMVAKFDLEERDLFEKIQQAMRIKIEVLEQHPEIFSFLEKAYLEEHLDVKEDIQKINNKKADSAMQQYFSNIDVTKFKEHLDISKVINIVMWTVQSYGDAEVKKGRIDYNRILAGVDEYMAILKSSFYK